ncbi:hypothetical protein [Streptomyces griseomycini]|uniref:Uncharacterized protein n=1 Tax=Streptomyces griseomycini TaxID=66895 RepID=A0A7W7PWT9_9ACTN|nr:hypothetical protein [Streptomyces griseomycini]MBB4902681.1 hypothetical protein [Streptomyces griseomycini]GGR54810.1 hypothetical protein GCM10015536_70170 [Streptomyces griseomycini]
MLPLTQAPGTQLLDVVDEVLLAGAPDEWEIEVLGRMLDDAGSACQIDEAGDGLEERVTPAVRGAVRQTIADAAAGTVAGSAAAPSPQRGRAYGRGPDPMRAHSEAIKAVECAALGRQRDHLLRPHVVGPVLRQVGAERCRPGRRRPAVSSADRGSGIGTAAVDAEPATLLGVSLPTVHELISGV